MISRRTLLTFFLAAALLLVPTFLIVHPQSPAFRLKISGEESFSSQLHAAEIHQLGEVIMPKMGNATAKAQLGNAGWRLLHTMAQRYPEDPTLEQRDAFKSFVTTYLCLSSAVGLYPCGECASHFQQLLKDYPPQTANRNSASLYLCMLHNKVNTRLDKEEFDCSQLEGLYDCGCAEDPDEMNEAEPNKTNLPAPKKVDDLTGDELVPGRRRL